MREEQKKRLKEALELVSRSTTIIEEVRDELQEMSEDHLNEEDFDEEIETLSNFLEYLFEMDTHLESVTEV